MNKKNSLTQKMRLQENEFEVESLTLSADLRGPSAIFCTLCALRYLKAGEHRQWRWSGQIRFGNHIWQKLTIEGNHIALQCAWSGVHRCPNYPRGLSTTGHRSTALLWKELKRKLENACELCAYAGNSFYTASPWKLQRQISLILSRSGIHSSGDITREFLSMHLTGHA